MALDFNEHNETVLATLEEGDLVEFRRGLFSHWGIYVGKGDIVHFGGVDISSTAVDSSCCSAFTKCGTGHRKASVEKETFMKVAGQSKAQKNNDKDKTTPPLSIEDIRKNVSLSLKLRLTSYNPLLNNCEHFATGCRYGTKSSQQADTPLTVAKSIGTAAVLELESGPTTSNATNLENLTAGGRNQAGGVHLVALVDAGRRLHAAFTGGIDRRSFPGGGIMERALPSLVSISSRCMLNSIYGIHASGNFLFDMGCYTGTCVWNSATYGMNWPK